MTNRQKLTLFLFIAGFGLSASPLLLILGSNDLSAIFDCLIVDFEAGACVLYGDSFVRVLYSTFIAGGQQYLFVTVPVGMLMIAIGLVLTFIDDPRNYNK